MTATFSPQPKSRPAKLDRDQRRQDRARIDRNENAKVKRRSGGRCEVAWALSTYGWEHSVIVQRCSHRAVHIHHLLGGWGRRNRGPSIEARYKLHVCDTCHADIHGKVLVPVQADADAQHVRFRRRT